MILQSLYNYYIQKASEPDSGIAPPGFEWKEIPFVIVIDRSGNFLTLEDTRDSKMKRPNSYLLPKSVSRSGSNAWMKSNLLWDHYGYVLGNTKSEELKNRIRAKSQLNTFINKIKSLPDSLKKDKGISAVLFFYEHNEYAKVHGADTWVDCIKINGCNMSFRLNDETTLIPCRQSIRLYIESLESSIQVKSNNGICLLTGMNGPIARIHSDTSISKDSKKIVSFQKNSGYDSYGKEQAYNAPTSRMAEFAYTTALNRLLARNSKNRLKIGNITLVFWAEKKNFLENLFPLFFCFSNPENPDTDYRAIAAIKRYVSLASKDASAVRFYVLGLGPNSARISVRFWCESTEIKISDAIIKHYEDIDIVRSTHDIGHYSAYWLFAAMAADNKFENISQNLLASILSAIISAEKYPIMMLRQTLCRIRSMRNVRRMQAGILKAYLNRAGRFNSSCKEEVVSVSLDTNNLSTAYLLGRLFAAFEKIHELSISHNNSTMRDRFYTMASSTPAKTYPQLFRVNKYNLEKIKINGLRRKYENLLTEIIDKLNPDLPLSMEMEDQARFAIGYYHQKSDLKKLSNS